MPWVFCLYFGGEGGGGGLVLPTTCYSFYHDPRPPLIEKLFPVDRPSGFKRADWNFFFHIFFKKWFFSHIFGRKFFKKKSVHSSHNKKKDFRLAVFPPGGQETIIHLSMALSVSTFHCRSSNIYQLTITSTVSLLSRLYQDPGRYYVL